MKSIFSKLLDEEVINVEQIIGGRNSQVYKLTCNNIKYCAKVYYSDDSDKIDRLGTEFVSTKFMWNNGIKCIPQPILASRENMCAVYEFIEGQKIDCEKITALEIGFAAEFILTLNKIKSHPDANNLPSASGACFSIEAIIKNVEQRLKKLQSIDEKGAPYEQLNNFLIKEFMPHFNKFKEKYDKELDYKLELPKKKRTLNPADFGFHNALRKNDGTITFLDFEFFGWDDPTKIVCDFMIHPGMNIEYELRNKFAEKIFNKFPYGEEIKNRTNVAYPLYVLRWCTILLNEFLPDQFLRRKFANEKINITKVQYGQLEKASKMLEKIKNQNYKNG